MACLLVSSCLAEARIFIRHRVNVVFSLPENSGESREAFFVVLRYFFQWNVPRYVTPSELGFLRSSTRACARPTRSSPGYYAFSPGCRVGALGFGTQLFGDKALKVLFLLLL